MLPTQIEWLVDYNRAWKKKLRHDVLYHYSQGNIKCSKCGITDERVLCLDHINNDGNKHRRRYGKYRCGGNSISIYSEVRRRGYPAGYQLLCWNCNHLKQLDRVKNIYE